MFGFIITFFNTFLYFPLLNALVLIYNYIPGHDFGLSITLLTLLIRLILYPVTLKTFKSQRALQSLQPKLQAIQEQYKQDKERQAKETLELYRKEKINPFGGLVLAFIQLPILIALYAVFRNGLQPDALSHLYQFVQNPGHINPMFLGIVDLSKPNIIFAVLAGVFQFLQAKLMMPKANKDAKTPEMAQMMQKQMLYVLPVLTVIILFKFPAALGLYLIVSGAFAVVQQYIILKQHSKT
jgi:YidC/Oxa1 family membrane protein insertase